MKAAQTIYRVLVLALFFFAGALWILQNPRTEAEDCGEGDETVYCWWNTMPFVQAVGLDWDTADGDPCEVEWYYEGGSVGSSTYGSVEWDHLSQLNSNISAYSVTLTPTNWLITTCSGTKDVDVQGDLVNSNLNGICVIECTASGPYPRGSDTQEGYLYIHQGIVDPSRPEI